MKSTEPPAPPTPVATSKLSARLPSDWYSRMVPVPAWMFSEKNRLMSRLYSMVPLSDGSDPESLGAESTAFKFRVVWLSLIHI